MLMHADWFILLSLFKSIISIIFETVSLFIYSLEMSLHTSIHVFVMSLNCMTLTNCASTYTSWSRDLFFSWCLMKCDINLSEMWRIFHLATVVLFSTYKPSNCPLCLKSANCGSSFDVKWALFWFKTYLLFSVPFIIQENKINFHWSVPSLICYTQDLLWSRLWFKINTFN